MSQASLPGGVYGMTAERFSRGRSNIDVVKAMIQGSVHVLQYREKQPNKQFRVILEECRAIQPPAGAGRAGTAPSWPPS